ncbi:hypothetical protein C4569_04060 [Candidatus Parcubacteria bacterium]|nr:MAG: hypothetical protein C4569_04060 [Candidatus Parcubacteria bacterium]
MKKKNFKIIVFFLILTAFSPAFGALAADSVFDRVSGNLSDTAIEAGLRDRESTEMADFALYLMRIINILLSFIGIVFLILIIYGGYLWMTASGNEEQVGKAKKMIIASVIGLAIVLMSRIIAEFVILALGESSAAQ